MQRRLSIIILNSIVRGIFRVHVFRFLLSGILRLDTVINKFFLDHDKALAYRVPQALGMEGAARAVHKAADTILSRLWLYFLHETTQPSSTESRFLKAKTVRSKNGLDVDAAV